MFNSHVANLLDATVALVNALTDGEMRGKSYVVPSGDALAVADAIRGALPPPSSVVLEIDGDQAARFAQAARDMRRVFECVDTQDIDSAAATVNSLLITNGARPQLNRVAGEPWRLHFHGVDDSLAVSWSAACATALALVIGGGLTSRLGVCRAERCDRVYVDSSRNAGREFCSLACQNRAKAAAFRARRSSKV
ncbi:CGNR zinc finger domain-containing protein [Catenulispora sp. GAS73]|uniref:CGNR zinc finger domain-containing protein n=1 Tax=Catenulispora sp. GAS73 TaxID=3156269 RepID=UPI0035196C6E